MIEYDTFPMKKFFKILKDDSLIDKYGISKEDWETLKETWNERHPTAEGSKLIEAHRKVIIEGLKLKRNINLFKALLLHKGDGKELFEVVALKYYDDPIKRIEYLKKEVQKSEQKLKIFDAQREQIEKEVSEQKEEHREEIDVNEVIASFELHGFTINDYETFPLGIYDAYTKLITKKEQRNG